MSVGGTRLNRVDWLMGEMGPVLPSASARPACRASDLMVGLHCWPGGRGLWGSTVGLNGRETVLKAEPTASAAGTPGPSHLEARSRPLRGLVRAGGWESSSRSPPDLRGEAPSGWGADRAAQVAPVHGHAHLQDRGVRRSLLLPDDAPATFMVGSCFPVVFAGRRGWTGSPVPDPGRGGGGGDEQCPRPPPSAFGGRARPTGEGGPRPRGSLVVSPPVCPAGQEVPARLPEALGPPCSSPALHSEAGTKLLAKHSFRFHSRHQRGPVATASSPQREDGAASPRAALTNSNHTAGLRSSVSPSRPPPCPPPSSSLFPSFLLPTLVLRRNIFTMCLLHVLFLLYALISNGLEVIFYVKNQDE